MLLIDVGNTKIRIGFVKNKKIVRHWRLVSDHRRYVDEYRILFKNCLAEIDEPLTPQTPVVLSSVVPIITHELEHLTQNVQIVTNRSKCSFKINLPEPSTLGSDRMADSEAAVQDYALPAIVVDLGTASTFSFIDAKKNFCGGAIAPGIGTSARALFDQAASLKPIMLESPKKVVGETTTEALQSGICTSHALMIEALVEKIKKEKKAPNAKVIITGGALELLEPLLPKSYHKDRTLTLRGLMYLSASSKGKS